MRMSDCLQFTRYFFDYITGKEIVSVSHFVFFPALNRGILNQNGLRTIVTEGEGRIRQFKEIGNNCKLYLYESKSEMKWCLAFDTIVNQIASA